MKNMACRCTASNSISLQLSSIVMQFHLEFRGHIQPAVLSAFLYKLIGILHHLILEIGVPQQQSKRKKYFYGLIKVNERD